MRRTIQKSARRSFAPRPRRRFGKRQSSHLHLTSKVETVITTKTVHKKREVYPLAVGSLFNPASVGDDTDIRMIGYSLRLDLATGNNTRTVSAAIAHSGPWVRQANGDGFNQTITTRPFVDNTLTISKRVLATSERQYLSPHRDQSNTLDLQIDDPCGAIPGCTIKITALIHFIRPHLPTMLVDAAGMAKDLYSDQDINGAVPTPPSSKQDIPALIRDPGGRYIPADTSANPVVYQDRSYPQLTFEIVPPAGIINIVGEFFADSTQQPALQTAYSQEGFGGQITFHS